MRTSRIARDTAQVLAASTDRRRAALSTRPVTPIKKEQDREDETALDDAVPIKDEGNSSTESSTLSSPPSSPSSTFDDHSKVPTTRTTRKRKLSTTTSPTSTTTRVKVETTTTTAIPARPPRAKRAPAKRIRDPTTGAINTTPPARWEETYAETAAMRAQMLAPVDTMGCESLADTQASPRDQRFQTLVSLMLSSQTKDTVTAAAVRDLKKGLPGGLCVEGVLAVEDEVLNELIGKVGFHNNKTKFIKAAAKLIQAAGDIPDTIEGLVALPGVGPKMAYLCMSAAWGRDEGIGVDVHVHRITNLWRWHKTKTPEETRAALEAWLPREKWHDINHLLVGFGQTWCPPVGRKCDKCMLAVKSLCPSAVTMKTTKKTKIEEEAKVKIEYSP